MKRALLLMLWCLPFSVILMAQQHYVPTQPLNKNAILEEFTGVTCPNCPAGHQVMAQILEDNPGRAFCVAFHPFNSSYTTPYPGDPDFRRHYADALYTVPYCGTSRYMPSSFVQRRVWSPPERLTQRNYWTSYANTVMAESSPMNVGMATSYDEGSKILWVQIDIYYTDDFPGDHNLMVTLAENNLISHQSGGTYPYVHKHTFRESFVAQWGDPILSDAVQGTFYTRTFTFQNDSNYVMENCDLLAYVIDNASTEIITGMGCAVGDTTFITPTDVTLSTDTLFFETAQQCGDGLTATLENNTGLPLDLTDVQQYPTTWIQWQVYPWPFTTFPYTLAPGESVDLTVHIALPLMEAGMEFYYDSLYIQSETGTQYLTIAVNQELYMGCDEKKISGILTGNFPNPFLGSTRITYRLNETSPVKLEIFSLQGESIRILENTVKPAGTFQVSWDGTNASSRPMPAGIYLYRLTLKDATLTNRCVRLK